MPPAAHDDKGDATNAADKIHPNFVRSEHGGARETPRKMHNRPDRIREFCPLKRIFPTRSKMDKIQMARRRSEGSAARELNIQEATICDCCSTRPAPSYWP
jgi:hypothetical protein